MSSRNPARKQRISVERQRKERTATREQVMTKEWHRLLVLGLFYSRKTLSAIEVKKLLDLEEKFRRDNLSPQVEEAQGGDEESPWRNWSRTLSLTTVCKILEELEAQGKLVHLQDRRVWVAREWHSLMITMMDSRNIASYSEDPTWEGGEVMHHYYSATGERPLVARGGNIMYPEKDPLVSYYLLEGGNRSVSLLRNPQALIRLDAIRDLLWFNALSTFYLSEHNRSAGSRRYLSWETCADSQHLGRLLAGSGGRTARWLPKFEEWIKSQAIPGRTFLVVELNNLRLVEALREVTEKEHLERGAVDAAA